MRRIGATKERLYFEEKRGRTLGIKKEVIR
jgi:hypothetical protein